MSGRWSRCASEGNKSGCCALFRLMPSAAETATGQRLPTMLSEWIFPVLRQAAFHGKIQAARKNSKKHGWPR
jgi:hypothetical protein